HPDTGTLFATWLSKEATEANHVKKETPVMVVMGNPPYSGESQNKGEWIMNLMDDYKKEPGGIEKLKERNPKWINDDYVKFLRYGQHFIENNEKGILAFVNPHGFLDNSTFRGMRWHLLKTYDKIYIIDLHGNSKKQEVCPDGSKDENVFDITQGVSINIFIKTGEKKANKLGQIFHYDLYGKRNKKYNFLVENNTNTISYKQIPNNEPMYFMVQKDFALEEEYEKGFTFAEIFKVKNVGIVTSRDNFIIDKNEKILKQKIKDFFTLEKEILMNKYKIKENKTWKIDQVKTKAKDFKETYLKKISYRPFDNRYIYYEDNFIERNRFDVMQHLIYKTNLGIMTNKKIEIGDFAHVFIYRNIVESHAVSLKEINYVFPLYLYTKNDYSDYERKPNLNMEIVNSISEKLNLTFTNEKEDTENTFAPIDLLDYIYGVLHSLNYRKKYKEFLKIDFPRVPYPDDADMFWAFAEKGKQLRELHLMESPELENLITSYPVSGDNIVEKPTFNGDEIGQVRINTEQYFDGV
ncbi:DNA methyltransferase, partial [Candidatus Dependentiae bacterium]|nr:DNA methyltransferase [Candidatus Dependentiae bacterium]